jgi:hypothetical protein
LPIALILKMTTFDALMDGYINSKTDWYSQNTLHGEANSASLTDIAEERLRLQQVLADYDLKHIYNADEMGLFYHMEPNQTLSTSSIAG